MSVTAADARYMARALELARRGLYTTDPNPRVGCVVVKNDRVVGEGFHARAGEAHAEVHALRQAGSQARDATVYVTLEPCCHQGRTPPCSDALLAAGVSRVVAAMQDPNPRVAGKGFATLESKGVAVEIGLMEAQARELNAGFVMRMKDGKPLVRVKLAASLDGRTALANGQSQWITEPAARADVQAWRARSSAIVTGVSTVLADDPRLTVRDIDIGRQPLRVVLDSRLRTPPSAQLLKQQGKTLIVAAEDNSAKSSALRAAGAEVIFLPSADGKVDLTALSPLLATRGVNEVLVESGATLAGAFLNARLADELVLYYAPCLMGDQGRAMFALPALLHMDKRIGLDIVDIRSIGKDWRVIARPQR